jgi:hypothetical protein
MIRHRLPNPSARQKHLDHEGDGGEERADDEEAKRVDPIVGSLSAPTNIVRIGSRAHIAPTMSEEIFRRGGTTRRATGPQV